MTITSEIMISNLRKWCDDVHHSQSGNFIIWPKCDVTILLEHIDAQAARIAELEKQYEDRTPTQWAYDQACSALEKHRERADQAEKVLSALFLNSGSK